MEEINRTPAILLTRTIDKDHCIRFQSKYYFPVTENGDRRYFARKTNCMVIESFDRQFLANIADKLYLMEEVPKHELVSKEFDAPKEAPKKERKEKAYSSNESSMEKRQLCELCCKKSTVVAMSLS